MVDWVETIGPVIVGSLAEKCSVTLSQNLITFLNKFGDKVETASKSLRSKTRRSLRAMAELNSVNIYVEEEVERLRTTILGGRLDNKQYFYVESHPETYLPVVHLHLKDLPEIIVHVYRSYGVRKKGISFGFRLRDFCEGQLTGKLAQAANYLRQKCRSADWQLSVTEVLQIWIQRAKNIPPSERGPTIQRHYFADNLPIDNPESRDREMISRKRTPSPEPSQITQEPYFDDDNFGTPQVMSKLQKTERRTSFRVTDSDDILDVDEDKKHVKKSDRNANRTQHNESSNATQFATKASKLPIVSNTHQDKSERNDKKVSVALSADNDPEDQSHLHKASNEHGADRMSRGTKRGLIEAETPGGSVEAPVTEFKRRKSIDVDTSYLAQKEASEIPPNADDYDMNHADAIIELTGNHPETKRSRRFEIVDEDGDFTSDVEKESEDEHCDGSRDSEENSVSEAPVAVKRRFRIVDDEVESNAEAENQQEDTVLADRDDDAHGETAHELGEDDNQESLPMEEVQSKVDSNNRDVNSETSKDAEQHLESNIPPDHSSLEPEPTLSTHEKSTASITRRYQIVDDGDYVASEGDKVQTTEDAKSTEDHPTSHSAPELTENDGDDPSDTGDQGLKHSDKERSPDQTATVDTTTVEERASEQNQTVEREMEGNDEDGTTENERHNEKSTEEEGTVDEGTLKTREDKEVPALTEDKSNLSREDAEDDAIPVVDITKSVGRERDFTGSSNFGVVHDEFGTFESEVDRRDAESDIDLNIDENI